MSINDNKGLHGSFLDADGKLLWPELYKRIPLLRAMEGICQDALFHGEGDVLIHTQMVCEALLKLPEWQQLDAAAKDILFMAALLHDVGKPACTKTDNNRITSRGHAVKGESLTRRFLYTDGLNGIITPTLREKIAKFVRFHGLPMSFLEKENPVHAVLETSQFIRLDWLAMLAKADAIGRKCVDKQDLFARIDLFSEFCRELDCWQKPRAFADAYCRFKYFQKDNGNPCYQAYDDTKFEVILLSGLPAAGKDTWVNKNCADLPVVSLDKLREELKISPTAEQGLVVQTAKERAREFLRVQQGFVWNATNLTKKTRRQLIDLFSGYGAKVRIVYVEAPYKEILKRNRERTRYVPEKVIDKMIDKLEVPDITEAPVVKWNIQ
jgi:putative nucleotidyltransferase with HDIG domain